MVSAFGKDVVIAPEIKLNLLLIITKRIPSLNWLRVFEAAERTSSFARAAERLAMSPPAVSQKIRALEEHLGRALFNRAPAGVSLTEAGRQLLVVASDSIGRMEAAAEALASPQDPPLVVAVSQTFYTGWLAPRLKGFLDAHPDIPLKFLSLIGDEIPPHGTDLWISFGQPPPHADGTRLFGKTLVPVTHADIAKTIRSLDGLLVHTLIEVSDHRKNWAQIFGLDILPSDARCIQVDTTLAALSLASGQCGVALAPPPASDDLVQKYELVYCDWLGDCPGVEDYHILSNAGVPLTAAAQTFKTWILKEAETPSDIRVGFEEG